jgi:two-component sensor histidine kinase
MGIPPGEAEGGAGGAPALPALAAVATAYEGAAPHVSIDCDPDLRAPPGQVEAVGCLVAEAVAAAVANPRGAPASVWISLSRDGGRLRLRVRDDGPGIADQDLEGDPRRVLIERLASQLGGRVKQGSAAFGGGEVVASFPAEPGPG